MTNTTTAATQGAMNDLSIAADFLLEALQQIKAGAAPGDREVQMWVDLAVRKVGPLRQAHGA